MLEKHIRNGIIRYNQQVCISQKLQFQTIEIEITLILLKIKLLLFYNNNLLNPFVYYVQGVLSSYL